MSVRRGRGARELRTGESGAVGGSGAGGSGAGGSGGVQMAAALGAARMIAATWS
ncbi:hypothetical protein ABZ729_32945 [Streptomyces sp. NPDC006678]|uniref:hypothetical protein n=1 Tax=Streptomyces sp. NPDC006678 TaxID=3157185 RepID=UPI0033D08021